MQPTNPKPTIINKMRHLWEKIDQHIWFALVVALTLIVLAGTEVQNHNQAHDLNAPPHEINRDFDYGY